MSFCFHNGSEVVAAINSKTAFTPTGEFVGPGCGKFLRTFVTASQGRATLAMPRHPVLPRDDNGSESLVCS
jgi:hypothetical protein